MTHTIGHLGSLEMTSIMLPRREVRVHRVSDFENSPGEAELVSTIRDSWVIQELKTDRTFLAILNSLC
jgi:hypothetical protein